MTKNNEIINDLLGFHDRLIIQRPDTFRFSLDSALLAYFVNINFKDKMIIDLGCGNGSIPLFLSKRTKNKIIGVEIQDEIADMAKRSVVLNHLENQIDIINGDIKDIHHVVGISRFDIAICNPPYFPIKSKELNKNDYLTIARHEVNINLEEVFKASSILLKDGARLYMVHRTERLLDIIECARKYHFELKKIQFVYSKKTSQTSLIVLIEAYKSNKTGGLKILSPLYIYNKNDTYTKIAKKIFGYED